MNFILAGLLAAVSFFGSLYFGYHIRDLSAQLEQTQAHLAFERKINAANTATEIDRDRIAGELKQSEGKIDELGQKYREIQDKLTENACPLSDDDMRVLWDGSGTPGAKPAIKRRVRHPARKTPAP